MSLLVENVEVSLAKLAFFIFASAFFKKFNAKCGICKKNQLIILFDQSSPVSGKVSGGALRVTSKQDSLKKNASHLNYYCKNWFDILAIQNM